MGIALISMGLVGCTDSNDRLATESADRMATDSAGCISLVENGKPVAAIVLPADADSTLREAAAELSSYIRKLSGAELPVCGDIGEVQGAALVLGDKDAPLPPVEKPREQYASESFSVRVGDGNIYFGGRSSEAIAYGVLAFIEDNLGVRWFAPGALWEYLPPHENGELKVQVSSKVVTPDTAARLWSYRPPSESWEEWLRKNRGASVTKRFRDKYSANTMYKIFPAKKYAETHPEYYPLVGGKRVVPPAKPSHGTYFWPCVSNRDVMKTTAEYIGKWFDENPGNYSFSLGMNDVTSHCHCEKCLAMDPDPGAISRDDLIERTCLFVNAVAEELKKTHPDRYLGMLIYRHLYKVPQSITKMEDNVFVYICCESASWWGGEDGSGLAKIDKEVAAGWAEITSLPVSRYDYIGSGSFTPQFFPHLLDRRIKFDHRQGMEGNYIEFYTLLPNSAPMVWAMLKLQWDAELGMDALLQEFYDKMFGSASAEMKAYYDFLEQVWTTPKEGRENLFLRLTRRYDQQCLAISPSDIDEGKGLLEAALAAADNAAVQERITIVKDALEFTEYPVKSFWLNRDIRLSKIQNLEQAEALQADIAKYFKMSRLSREVLAKVSKQNNILGESVRALQSFSYLMLDEKTLGNVDGSLVSPIFGLIDWYGKNAEERMPELKKSIVSMELPETVRLAVEAYLASGGGNLLENAGFEEVNPSTGIPDGWSAWVRPSNKYQTVLSTMGSRENVGLNNSSAVVFSTGTGGNFYRRVPVKPGEKYFASVWLRGSTAAAAKAGQVVLKFKDGNDKYLNRDANKRVLYEEVFGVATTDWQRLTASVTVPDNAEYFYMMIGSYGCEPGAEQVFDDALLLPIQ